MWVEVSKVAYDKLIDIDDTIYDQHTQMKQDIAHMHQYQEKHFQTKIGRMNTKQLAQNICISKEVKEFYDIVSAKLQISARSYTNILKVAFTISLLDNQPRILKEHILEALSYRPQDKFMGI
jgi:magnesium chelatase family protein